ncbi:MAG TPA: hypothetical protein VJ870_14810 [Amycolatopsis sp.]|nr:hypothetical protein [Amycolatopsis sp.]
MASALTLTKTPDRYATVADPLLAATLRDEDEDEQRGALSPHDRTSCRVHRRWLHQCVSSPTHVIPVTGHRWCLRCDAALAAAVDELAGSVELRCTRCARRPQDRANQQLVRACSASFAASRGRRPERVAA